MSVDIDSKGGWKAQLEGVVASLEGGVGVGSGGGSLTATKQLKRLSMAIASGFAKTKTLTIDEWSEQHIFLDSSSTANPGRYRLDKTPYLREIFRELSPSSPTKKVVLMWGAQLAKTQCMLNTVLSYAQQDPCPILMVLPREEDCKKVSNQRLSTTIRNSPTLKSCFTDFAKTTSATSTLLQKTFQGGVLYFAGGNSATALRSMPARVLVMDEIDGMPSDLDGEGSPVSLAEVRTATFAANKKILLTSTPTLKGESAIDEQYERSDKRLYHLPCPHCGHHQVWTIDKLKWDGEHADTAHIQCDHCQGQIQEKHKYRCLQEGVWRATCKAKDTGTVGYHLNSLCSPFRTFEEILREYIRALENSELMKSFVNLVLGLAYEESGEVTTPDSLLDRRAPFPDKLPNWVKTITSSMDTQGSRFEMATFGWGPNKEWVLLNHITEPFGVDESRIDDAFDHCISVAYQPYACQDGRVLETEVCFVDSGGNHTSEVYRLVASQPWQKRVIAIKGSSNYASNIVKKVREVSKTNQSGCPFLVVGVSQAKDVIFSMLQAKEPGAGFLHLPDWLGEATTLQLCSERRIRKNGKLAWVKVAEGRANELWDLCVYAYAALQWKGKSWLVKMGVNGRVGDGGDEDDGEDVGDGDEGGGEPAGAIKHGRSPYPASSVAKAPVSPSMPPATAPVVSTKKDRYTPPASQQPKQPAPAPATEPEVKVKKQRLQIKMRPFGG